MDQEMLQRANVINNEMNEIFNRAEKLKSALQTMENGHTSHELSVYGGAHKVELDPWVIKKALTLNIAELEKRYDALSVELEEL